MPFSPRTRRYRRWTMALAIVLLHACAWSPERAVPPPAGLMVDAVDAPAAPLPSLPMARRAPAALPSADPGYPPARGALAPGSMTATPVLTTSPLALTAAPTIYYAPPTAAAPPARNSPQVLQAEPGPALSLDFTPNPAWKRAEIPPGSNAASVGRVPPPAATPGFTIGAGDTVQIDVLGRPELTARGNVSGDGQVTAALIGPVRIAGLSPQQAAERIGRAYKDGQYLIAPQVTLTMVEYQSQQLTVLGEVRNPGRFPMRTRLSVLDGIALSGGITEQGGSLAYLLRPEDSVVTRYEIDLEALIQAGAGQQYFELIAGDTLVVPKTEQFYIYGEVRNPNAYKLKPGMTVIQALSLAGGLTDKGSDRRIDIRRRDADGRLRSLSASLNESLVANDVMYVRERLF